METDSERLFRQVCRHNWLLAFRLKEKPDRKRPDFFVLRWWWRVAVEVKQFDPNPEERSLLTRRAAGEILAYGGEPGKRVRDAIATGSPQLRAETGGRWPGLLVVFNNTGLRYHDDPYHILTAMFGLEAVILAQEPSPSTQIHRLGMKFVGKRRVTPSANRAVSAVGRLYQSPRAPALDIFHNPFADAPLNHRRWRGRTIRHFTLSEPDAEGRRGWQAR